MPTLVVNALADTDIYPVRVPARARRERGGPTRSTSSRTAPTTTSGRGAGADDPRAPPRRRVPSCRGCARASRRDAPATAVGVCGRAARRRRLDGRADRPRAPLRRARCAVLRPAPSAGRRSASARAATIRRSRCARRTARTPASTSRWRAPTRPRAARRLELVPFRWPELASRLAAGDFDVAMSGVTVRADRLLTGTMTAAVARADAVLLVRQGDETRRATSIDPNGASR